MLDRAVVEVEPQGRIVGVTRAESLAVARFRGTHHLERQSRDFVVCTHTVQSFWSASYSNVLIHAHLFIAPPRTVLVAGRVLAVPRRPARLASTARRLDPRRAAGCQTHVAAA